MIRWTPAKKIFAVAVAAIAGWSILESRRRYFNHNRSPLALDPDLKDDVRDAVLSALVYEHDSVVLRNLGHKLRVANHPISAAIVNSRADAMSGYRVGEGLPSSLQSIPRVPPPPPSSTPVPPSLSPSAMPYVQPSLGGSGDGYVHTGLGPVSVRQVQSALNAIGYMVPVDGVMGSQTVLAIKRFQSLHGFDIDGVLNTETVAAILAAAERG